MFSTLDTTSPYYTLNALTDGLVVITGGHRAFWFKAEEMMTATSSARLEWHFAWSFPRGDRAARTPGLVTASGRGWTNVDLGSTRLSLGPTSLQVGERVTLVDLLWQALSITQFREVIRANGSCERLPGAPTLVDAEVTDVEPVTVATPPLRIPRAIRVAVDALQAEGRLAEADGSVIADLVDGAPRPDSVQDFLVEYYTDPRRGAARAAADRFTRLDYRYGIPGSAPDHDVIAYLTALYGRPSPLRQVEINGRYLVVEGPSGREIVPCKYVEGFDMEAILEVFDRALGERGSSDRFFVLPSTSIDLAFYVMPIARAERLRSAGLSLRSAQA